VRLRGVQRLLTTLDCLARPRLSLGRHCHLGGAGPHEGGQFPRPGEHDIVGCYRRYLELNDVSVSSWPKALTKAITEFSGTLYCIVVVLFAAIGFALIITNALLLALAPLRK